MKKKYEEKIKESKVGSTTHHSLAAYSAVEFLPCVVEARPVRVNCIDKQNT